MKWIIADPETNTEIISVEAPTREKAALGLVEHWRSTEPNAHYTPEETADEVEGVLETFIIVAESDITE